MAQERNLPFSISVILLYALGKRMLDVGRAGRQFRVEVDGAGCHRFD